jgi:Ca-activated chloride channel homolog
MDRLLKNSFPVGAGKQLAKGALYMSLLLLFLAVCGTTTAQTSRYIQQGNKLYEQQKYKEAADDYSKVLAKDPTNTTGLFNFGNSLYQQKQFDSSRKVMAAAEKTVKDKPGKAAANYNIGNTYMSQQKWEDAINSYKQTLRNNPQDADAKYNLSYAEQMLKKQNQDKQNKDKQNKNQQDKDKDKKQDKNKDKDKQDKDKQDKDQQDKNDQQNKDQQQPQSQPSKLSQQQADQLLNALQQQEKKLQDKMKKEKGVPVKMQKDW